MSWIVVFVSLVVLLVAVYVGMGWWQRTVERERRRAAQRLPRVFESWQEAPPDEQDPPGGG
jgi:predicted negative regulator of RcsB-dependent stress response